MYRNIAFSESYHIFNRGNNKQEIFKEERDWIRFLFIILHFQSNITFDQIGRHISYYVKHRMFDTKNKIPEIVQNRSAELISFTLMPNHFHLSLTEIKEGGISEYLRRIQDAYTKYFNIKYKRTGHLFQGSYKSVHIENNEQLLHLSAYIHKNAKDLKEWEDEEYLFPWSSYQDYRQNRWGKLLKPDIVLEQFNNFKEYQKFVKTSLAKEKLSDKHLLI